MRPSAIAVVAVIGACGRVGFDVLPGDAGSRDAFACINPVGHDEDGDSIDDACDNCPTVANPLQENVGETQAGQAADAVGDACDPNPTTSGDVIAYFDPLLDGVGLTTTGITGIGGDIATVGASSSVETTDSIQSPTEIVFDFTIDGSTPGGSVEITANSGGIGCGVEFLPCLSGSECFSAFDGGTELDSGWNDNPSSVTQLGLIGKTCVLHAATTPTLLGLGVLVPGTIGIVTGPGTGITVTSIIAYGM